jgi:cysteine desulfurase family protein (TIGR01976 family)
MSAAAHERLRALFPSLAQEVAGQPAVFLDGPGGTQTPRTVVHALASYLGRDNANTGGAFATSQRTGEMVAAARAETARFLGAARAEEIVFGQNMTSLTFALSHALARTWAAGDEVVVTSLDHDANVAPWLMAAADAGAAVRTWDFRVEDCTLPVAGLEPLLNARTRLVALTHASNAVGTIPDVAGAVRLVRAKAPEALVFIDAVHYAPHHGIDIQALDCDFLACSAYKFCGPHLGILYGKLRHLEGLEAYKVRASSSLPPGKWETGTQNFEAIAGLRACLAYLGALGDETHGPAAMDWVVQYEAELSRQFLAQARDVAGLRVYGITDPDRVHERTPTFGVTVRDRPARAVAERLGERGVFVWDGHFYALGVVERLGLADQGGLVRIGFAHYNTPEEVSRVIGELAREAARAM